MKTCCIWIFWVAGILLVCCGGGSSKKERSCNSYIRHPESMKDLIKHEFNVIKEFVERKNNAPTSKVLLHTLLDTYLKSFEEGTNLGAQAMVRRAKVKNIVERMSTIIYNNPLAMYSTIRRTSEYLPTTLQVITKDYNISKEFLDFDGPDRGEVEGAMKAILSNLQLYHGLEPSQLAEGEILGTSTGVKMNAGQCKEMGAFARIRGFYSYAVEWLELARQKVAAGDNSATSSSLVDIELKKAISVTEKEKSELFCWYESAVHYFYSIGPLKMEFLSRSPDIVQMYDVVGNTTLNRMKLLSKDKYQHRTISGQAVKTRDKREKCGKGDEDQSVFIAWLTNSNLQSNRRVWTLFRNVGLMTNLETSESSTESLKLLSMNFANKLRLQLDSPKGQMIRNSQDGRLATFMFYMEDVELGGFSVFPLAGVAARPVKGSAVFWYNLYGNATQSDYSTIHAECPPIIGEKIVATRWIKFKDQFQNLPCPLDQNQRFRIKVNGK